MAETLVDIRKVGSTLFYPAVVDGGYGSLVFEPTSEGDVVTVNGREIPIVGEEFKLSIVQSASTKGNKILNSHIGDVRLHLGEEPADDEFYEEMYLLPVCVIGYRFDKYDKYDPSKPSQPLCFSIDGRVPYVRNGVTPISDKCAEYTVLPNGEMKVTRLCPAAKWGDGGDKPTCQQSMKVAFITLPEAIPVVMSLHGTGLSAFNSFMKQRRKALSVARIKKRSLSRTAVRLYTEDKGTYSAIKFSLQETPEEYGSMEGYMEVARYYRDTLFAPMSDDKPVDIVDDAEIVTDVDVTPF